MPKSRSLDGKFALYYQPVLHGAAGSPEFTVYFCGPGRAQASAQIDPDFGNDYLGKPGVSWKPEQLNKWDTQGLLDMICRCNEFHLKGELFDSGFFYSVTWTPDSRWVVIEGGAHKFWHMAAYHFADGQFREVDLATLSSQIESYFAAHRDEPAFQELGINKEITSKWSKNHESHYVTWLEDGRFAVLGYSFLLLNDDFNRLREKGEIYFLVDCRNPYHAKVMGMAR
jgi:hypothetical protein